MQEKIAITGTSGFIGSHVADFFCSQGVPLNCIVRYPEKAVQNKNINFIKGDITDINSLNVAFKNTDFIIHIAGLSRDWGKYEDFYNNNVLGTINVLKAAHNNGIKDIIITGSISSYGEENSRSIKNENSPYNSHYNYFGDSFFPSAMNYYRDTKALATQEAIKFAETNNLNLTIIEPTWVYGECEFNTGFYEYLKTAKSGIPFLPGSKKNKFEIIYARDLARCYYLAFEKKLPGINRIIAGSTEKYLMNDIYENFCKELGKKKPANMAKAIVYPIGFLLEALYTIFNIKTPPLLSRSRINMLYDNLEFSVKKAEELLGFKTEISLDEGIKKTVTWYKENGYL